MELHTFIVDSAQEALDQIREELGPDAIVVSVRKLPANGLGRIWKAPQIEVVAGVQAKIPTAPEMPLPELREEIEIRKQERVTLREEAVPAGPFAPAPEIPAGMAGGWRVRRLLEQAAFPPLLSEQIVSGLEEEYGLDAPGSLRDELDLARRWLARAWPATPTTAGRTHVFIGQPGSGKSTVLCKWLAQASLIRNAPAAVLQLDAHISNASPLPSLYAEIVGARFERTIEDLPAEEMTFVDLPGIDYRDKRAFDRTREILSRLPDAEIHLVLNAAYETNTLLAQARGFSGLNVTDLIFTHLDEENRCGKLWAVMLGTNFSVRFTSSGQNIPGDFQPASAATLFRFETGRK